MGTTGLDSFDATIQKTNLILEDIEDYFGWIGRRDQAYDALRAVLQTLRDRLEPNEAVDLGAQLPMIVRGFYYEGWKPSQTPVKWKKAQFLAEVRYKFPLSMEYSTEDLVKGVISVLSKHISEGELKDVLSNLPHDIRPLFETEKNYYFSKSPTHIIP